ncbi:hypothetical protein SH528x_005077 [Novipirellula sp. SH528]|uniref:hypothetical protein n=1 Tax=Novipirellula sp. SH528 TaxID=3454466 RepID=UPI003F9FFB61
MNFQIQRRGLAGNRFRLTILAIGLMATIVGCGGGGDAGVIAGQDEISKFIQDHPELKDESGEEEKAAKPEAPPTKQAVRPSDA